MSVRGGKRVHLAQVSHSNTARYMIDGWKPNIGLWIHARSSLAECAAANGVALLQPDPGVSSLQSRRVKVTLEPRGASDPLTAAVRHSIAFAWREGNLIGQRKAWRNQGGVTYREGLKNVFFSQRSHNSE